MKRATRIISSTCENRLKHRKRLKMSARNPFARIYAIMVSSHSRPAVTWRPWHPTSMKKAERSALRVGPAPRATSSANSRTSSRMNTAPMQNMWNDKFAKNLVVTHLNTLDGSPGAGPDEPVHRLGRTSFRTDEHEQLDDRGVTRAMADLQAQGLGCVQPE